MIISALISGCFAPRLFKVALIDYRDIMNDTINRF